MSAVMEQETGAAAVRSYPPLESENRPSVDTAAAAYYLNRRPQTLRQWACSETYPEGLKPRSVNGRLLWPVDGLRKLCGVAA